MADSSRGVVHRAKDEEWLLGSERMSCEEM